MSSPPPLTPHEIAAGAVFGHDPGRTPDNGALRDGMTAAAGSVLDRLADVLIPALGRPPCLVSFSGGMDSSFLLAAAARTARRLALPDPVPITWRFTRAPAADESDRQDAVVAAIGLGEHIVLAAGEDLDLLGPVATEFLTRFGLRSPANLFLHLPLIAAAAGGSLITGAGGDQVLVGHAASRPSARGLRRAVVRAVPPRMLAPVVRRRDRLFPWLTPGAARRITTRYLAERRGRPASGLARMRYEATGRALALTAAGLSEMGRHFDTVVRNPFLDVGVQAAFAGLLADRPGARRPELLTAASAGELPSVVTTRHPKARLHQVFIRSTTADFIRRPPDPAALPPGVDPAALHAFWSSSPGSTATGLLIQHLWLQQHPAPGRVPLDQGPSFGVRGAG